ncbi:hypothetical protein Tco_0401864 [Tanacetum coccineum]
MYYEVTPPVTYSAAIYFGGTTDWYLEPSTISLPHITVSSDSDAESVESSASLVILLDTEALVDVHHVVIICDEKIVRSDRSDCKSDGKSESRWNIISCTKTQKYFQKGCHVYLAHITEKKPKDKSEDKRPEDVPTVRDLPEVFPEDLPGLPST